jgi:hypothetical protein
VVNLKLFILIHPKWFVQNAFILLIKLVLDFIWDNQIDIQLGNDHFHLKWLGNVYKSFRGTLLESTPFQAYGEIV